MEPGRIEKILDRRRRVRALRAMARMQEKAADRGLSELSTEEIDEEIREARRARKRVR